MKFRLTSLFKKTKAVPLVAVKSPETAPQAPQPAVKDDMGPTPPEVGIGATICYYSDTRPATVISIRHHENGEPWQVVTQEDHHKVISREPNLTYEYSPNPNGRLQVFSKRKNGCWVAVGEPYKTGTMAVFGHRRYYFDPHF